MRSSKLAKKFFKKRHNTVSSKNVEIGLYFSDGVKLSVYLQQFCRKRSNTI